MGKTFYFFIGLAVVLLVGLTVWAIYDKSHMRRCQQGEILYKRKLVPAGKVLIWKSFTYDKQGRCKI